MGGGQDGCRTECISNVNYKFDGRFFLFSFQLICRGWFAACVNNNDSETKVISLYAGFVACLHIVLLCCPSAFLKKKTLLELFSITSNFLLSGNLFFYEEPSAVLTHLPHLSWCNPETVLTSLLLIVWTRRDSGKSVLGSPNVHAAFGLPRVKPCRLPF